MDDVSMDPFNGRAGFPLLHVRRVFPASVVSAERSAPMPLTGSQPQP